MKEHSEQNIEHLILETAEKLFLEKGFAITSMTEIAKVAGCNQALVHYYYRSKEKLFTAIFNRKLKLFFSELVNYNSDKMPFEEKLKRKIEAHFNLLSQNPQLPFFIFNELLTNSERLGALRESIKDISTDTVNTIQAELDMEIKKGNIRPVSLMDLVLTILSLNVMLFLVKPMLMDLMNISDNEYKKIIEHRKQENVRIIMASLKP